MKNRKKTVIAAAIASGTVMVLVICAFAFGFKIWQPQEQPDTKGTDGPGSTVSETQEITSADTTSPTEIIPPTSQEPSETIQPKVSQELSRLLRLSDLTADRLTELGCKQLVTVESSGSEAQIGFYELQNDEWVENDKLLCTGYVGRNGVTEDMHEGGKATPKGLYSVGEAFYIDDIPTTGLDTFQITEDTYWVDDPDSSMYNRRVEGRKNADWSSAEHMIDYRPSYDYGFVIDYNTEAVYNAGSAIFFHISGRPTAGCVGTDTDMVLRYLAALEKTQKPYILIL